MTLETSLAAGLYAAGGAVGTGRPAQMMAPGAQSFSDTLAQAAQRLQTTMQRGEQAMNAAATGAADIHEVVEALSATEMALETTVVMRDRVVEAYQEILRMPV
ncbi:MAG: flagellar hook-basal body complex protein FliE [Pseudomonadota bacterium]